MDKITKKIAVILIAMFFLIGCTNFQENKKVILEETTVDSGQALDEKSDNSDGTKNEKDDNEKDEDDDPTKSIDLTKQPNEAGQIMVLMYHNIGEKESDWVRTPENFKRDLEILYKKGYRPISLKDFVANNINVEAGFTPIVITFDDGNKNNFNIIEKDGKKVIDPKSAVGILEKFGEDHPDFPVTATFFVFGSNPFRQKDFIEYKLNYLIENGYDVGNHTIGHNDLTNLRSEELQKVIGKNAVYLEGFMEDYKVNTLALPYGSRPDKEFSQYLEKGIFEGVDYENIAILNVGWDPSVSPIDKKFNPYSIHRIRASEMNVQGVGMYDWLSHFDKNREKRYISDGNPNVVTVPKGLEDKIDKEKLKDKYLYIYEEAK